MKEASKIKNGNGEQEKIGNHINQSINQSSTLHLVQNEDLKKLLKKNPGLKKEVEETKTLINSLLKIKTIEEFDKIVNKMTQLGFKTAQKAKGKAEKLDEVQTEEKLKSYLNAKKFCYYEDALCCFLNLNFSKFNDGYVDLFGVHDSDLYKHESEFCKFSRLIFSQLESIITINDDHKLILNNPRDCSGFGKVIVDLYNPKVRSFVIQQLMPLIVLRNNVGLTYIRSMMVWFYCLLVPNTILLLLSNPDRYNFFLQFHYMLEKNLCPEDKRLFYDYLNACREKLQNKKDYYNWFIENNFSLFTRRENQLTGVVIFGVIASATVLTISLLEIYAATWFFWLGIVGVVLTVAVGIRLFLCLKEN